LLDGEKTQVDARLGVAARHRYFDRPGFRFVVLDTGAVSTYATLAGSEARREATAELACEGSQAASGAGLERSCRAEAARLVRRRRG
jgi:hypothetical protein